MNYEKIPYVQNTDWFKKGLVCSNNAYISQINTKRFAAQQMLVNGNFTSVDSMYNGYPCPGNVADIIFMINAGRSYLNYRGEGWSSGWWASCFEFQTYNVSSLNNGQKLTFVTSIGCGVAMFDASGGNCFGEEWVEMGTPTEPRGACAFVGPTSNMIFFGVREPPRGQAEPVLADLEHISVYCFNWETARGLFQKRTLRILYIQGFFGVFPWNVITYWFFNYLETERGYSQEAVFTTMVLAVLVLAAGYPLGGALGDYFFKRTPRGRALVAMTGVLGGAVMLIITLAIPIENQVLFAALLAVTALFIPMSAPNVVATVYDVTLPEVRSTALSVQYFMESSGAALAPSIAGWIADQSSLKTAFLLICVSTWLLCGVFFALVAHYAPHDVNNLRQQMRQRAEQQKALAA